MTDYKKNALSRTFSEGGYTFLKRVLAEHLKTTKPVVINVGSAYLQYQWNESQKTFMDGIKILDGKDKDSISRFRKVAETYQMEIGLEEVRREMKL
jgi:hypothetical protein